MNCSPKTPFLKTWILLLSWKYVSLTGFWGCLFPCVHLKKSAWFFESVGSCGLRTIFTVNVIKFHVNKPQVYSSPRGKRYMGLKFHLHLNSLSFWWLLTPDGLILFNRTKVYLFIVVITNWMLFQSAHSYLWLHLLTCLICSLSLEDLIGCLTPIGSNVSYVSSFNIEVSLNLSLNVYTVQIVYILI